MKLDTYCDFVHYVNTTGFMPMSESFPVDIPSLGQMTNREQWHTSDRDTDPWQWKDRAPAERALAFGCILGGYKGFISRELYPVFYALMRPKGTLEEMYDDGKISRLTLDVYALFETNSELASYEIREVLKLGKSVSTAKIDRSVTDLQAMFMLTVCGNKRKTTYDGREYGWAANLYARAEDWHADWLEGEMPSVEEAREQITAAVKQINNSADELTLFQTLKKRAK